MQQQMEGEQRYHLKQQQQTEKQKRVPRQYPMLNNGQDRWYSILNNVDVCGSAAGLLDTQGIRDRVDI